MKQINLYPSIDSTDESIINTLCNAFSRNRRMHLLIGTRNRYRLRLRLLMSYCYHMVKKVNGIHTSRNGHTHLVAYRKSEWSYTLMDTLRYLMVVIRTIRIHRILGIIKRERLIKSIREEEIIRNQDQDYLYVWFLAQSPEYNKIDGLVEVKNALINQALSLHLPIYMETTDQRLLTLYRRAGFHFYESAIIDVDGSKIWYGRLDPLVNSQSIAV